MTTPPGSDPSGWPQDNPQGGWPAPGQGQYPPPSGGYSDQTGGYPGQTAGYSGQTAGYPAYGGAAYPGQPAYPPDPSAPFGYDPQGRPYSDKQKLIAGILQIVLGGFGVGRFYTGHTGIGVAQIVVTIVTCGIGALWGLIDGIMILINGGFDAQGRPLREN